MVRPTAIQRDGVVTVHRTGGVAVRAPVAVEIEELEPLSRRVGALGVYVTSATPLACRAIYVQIRPVVRARTSEDPV